MTAESSPELWARVQAAFSDELQPEDPAKTVPYVAQRFKYLSRVGCYSEVCLVLIGMRQEKDSPPPLDFFRAYSFNRATNSKLEMGPGTDGFNVWKFQGFARFNREATPDIAFTWQSCTECEATYLLSSFRFDGRLRLWRLRLWPEGETSLFIGSDDQFGDEDDWRYECRFEVGDLTGDGLDDVGVWCRIEGLSTGKVEDEVFLYSVGPSGPKKSELKGQKALRLKRTLCARSPEVSPCDTLGTPAAAISVCAEVPLEKVIDRPGLYRAEGGKMCVMLFSGRGEVFELRSIVPG
ncbi:MAG: hypothetical protein ACM3JH_11530, partial [Acidithiobacillales bacterium]